MKRRMIFLLTAACSAYLFLLVGLFLLQRNMLYFPARDLGAPEQYGVTGFRPITLTAEDGMRLTAWQHDAAPGYPTIIYFHGNAGHLGYRAAKYSALAEAGFGVVALSYRGFGTSEGTPTEQGLYHDARSALNYAMGERGLPITRILLYGESLGSGIAVQMATEYPVAGLILEAPYTSILNRARAVVPVIVPVKLILKDHYASIDKIGQVKAPLLLFHGEKDQVVPVGDGRAILAAANEPKEGLFFPEVDHTQFDLPTLTSAMQRFGEAHGWFTPVAGAKTP